MAMIRAQRAGGALLGAAALMLTVGGLAAASANAEPPAPVAAIDTDAPIAVKVARVVTPGSPSPTVPAGTTGSAAAQLALAAASDYWRETTGGAVNLVPSSTVTDVSLNGSSCVPDLGAVVRTELGGQLATQPAWSCWHRPALGRSPPASPRAAPTSFCGGMLPSPAAPDPARLWWGCWAARSDWLR